MLAPERLTYMESLCWALARGWQPERRFMVLTAYMDESGTHAGSDLSVMAGFLGEARQWRKFEKRAVKLFDRFGVDVFHTIDLRRSDKDFAGWSVDRKIEFLDEFHHIINETLERGFASILRESDYQFYLGLPWPTKAKKDTRYAILFRACMAETLNAVIEVHGDGKLAYEPRLNVVLEAGHKNAPDALHCACMSFSSESSPKGRKRWPV